MRIRILAILLGALAVVATFTFPQWRPFFVTETIEELFPGLPPELVSVFQALPPEQQRAYLDMADEDRGKALVMVAAALREPSVVAAEEQIMPPMEAAQIIRRGTFAQVDPLYSVQGTVMIYQQPNNRKMLRFEGFQITDGPDLHVVLSASPAPTNQEELQLNNLDLELGVLKGAVGSQNYEIPAEVDLSLYNSVVVYCRRYNIIFTRATI